MAQFCVQRLDQGIVVTTVFLLHIARTLCMNRYENVRDWLDVSDLQLTLATSSHSFFYVWYVPYDTIYTILCTFYVPYHTIP